MYIDTHTYMHIHLCTLTHAYTSSCTPCARVPEQPPLPPMYPGRPCHGPGCTAALLAAARSRAGLCCEQSQRGAAAPRQRGSSRPRPQGDGAARVGCTAAMALHGGTATGTARTRCALPGWIVCHAGQIQSGCRGPRCPALSGGGLGARPSRAWLRSEQLRPPQACRELKASPPLPPLGGDSNPGERGWTLTLPAWPGGAASVCTSVPPSVPPPCVPHPSAVAVPRVGTALGSPPPFRARRRAWCCPVPTAALKAAN